MIFTFSVLDRKHPFWANLAQNQNCLFKLNFGAQTNLNKQKIVGIVHLIFLRPEINFPGKLCSKIQNCFLR